MRRVIIESPYAGDRKRNETYLKRCIKDSLDRGEAPFASHAIYTQVLDDDIPEQRILGIEAGLVWMDCVNSVIFYTDYGMSAGMEIALAKANRIGAPTEERTIGKNQ